MNEAIELAALRMYFDAHKEMRNSTSNKVLAESLARANTASEALYLIYNNMLSSVELVDARNVKLERVK